jgi:uncharacterized membrane protein
MMKYTDLNEMVSPAVNISERERLISGITGSLFLATGIFDFKKSAFRRLIRITAGSFLILRGITGHCPVVGLKDKQDESLLTEKVAP